MRHIYPLLSYQSRFLGITFMLLGLLMIGLSVFFLKINLDISIGLLCFGLFCYGYRREKDEDEEEKKYILYRYNAFRVSFALTNVIILICSSTFIFENTQIKINCLYALLLLSAIFNISYFIIKKKSSKSLLTDVDHVV